MIELWKDCHPFQQVNCVDNIVSTSGINAVSSWCQDSVLSELVSRSRFKSVSAAGSPCKRFAYVKPSTEASNVRPTRLLCASLDLYRALPT